MIVTMTNSIEGREISRYNDPIAANVVIGTIIFSDIGASYVDFFGDRSTSYEKKMQKCTKRCLRNAQAASTGNSCSFIYRIRLIENIRVFKMNKNLLRNVIKEHKFYK